MIPTDVYIEYLRKILQSQKTLYDYLQLILPIVSGFLLAVIGWIIASKSNKQSAIFQLNKEQYYRSRESITRIVTLFSEYLSYLYYFVKNTKNKFNTGEMLNEDLINDFITESQMKLAFIDQLLKIEFPAYRTNISRIVIEQRKIENIYGELSDYQRQLSNIQSKDELISINKKIAKLNTDNLETINRITSIVADIEVQVIKSLESDAVKTQLIKKKEVHMIRVFRRGKKPNI